MPSQSFLLRTPAVLVTVAMALVLLCLTVNAGVDPGPLDGIDRHVAIALNKFVSPHPTAVSFWKVITRAGSPVALDIVCGLVAIVLLVRRRWRLALFGVVALAGAAILSTVMKSLTNQPRPTLPVTLEHAGGMSFPSGHALTSFVAAGYLLIVVQTVAPRHARRWLLVLAAVGVLAVGFSRLILGVHFLTDVLGGWLTGALWLLACAVTLRSTPGPPRPPAHVAD